jgi:hypothetical protein
MWLTEATGEPGEAVSFAKPPRDNRIERLDQIVGERGLEEVAKQLGTSQNSIRSWLHGGQPNPVSFAKIEKFLADSATSPSNAGIEHSDELFVSKQSPATPEPAN